jgi:membrane protease YdiL (CAAX protease family)
MERARLLAALAAPTILVAGAMFGLGDVRVAFMAYVIGGCVILPRLLVGARPGTGLPFRTEQEHPLSPLVALFVFGPVFLLVYWIVRQYVIAPEPYVEALRALGWNDDHRYLYFALFVAAVPLSEEWWWRGQALPRAERLFGEPLGRLLVALGFAAYHAPVLLRLYPVGPAALRFSGIVVAAMVWTLIAARRRSWGWVWWAHLAADAVLVVAFILWVQPQA